MNCDSRPTLHATHAESDSSLLQLDYAERLTLHAMNGESENVSSTARFAHQCVYTGGVMYPDLKLRNGYRGPVVVDVMGVVFPSDPTLNRDHDAKRPVGHCPTVGTDGTAIYADGVFSLDNPDSREITAGRTSPDPFPWKPSVGLQLLEYRMVNEGEVVAVNGRSFEGPFLLVSRAQLVHIAIVSEPGDENVDPLLIAQRNPHSHSGAKMDFESWCKSLGLDPATLSAEAKTALQSQYDSMQASANASSDQPSSDDSASASSDPAPDDSAMASRAPLTVSPSPRNGARGASSPAVDQDMIRRTTRETLAAEHERANSIRTLCSRFANPQVSIGGREVDLAAHAIQQGLTLEQVELHALRHQRVEETRDGRSSGPAIHSRSRGADQTRETLQAGLMLRAGIALDSPQFADSRIRHRLPEWLRANVNDAARQRVMEGAHRQRMSTLDAAAAMMHATGHTVPSDRTELLHAAFSSGAVSQLFGTTLGAAVMRAYAEVGDFTVGWTQDGENPDLEEHNRVRMQAAQDLSHHPSGGESDHAHRQALSERAKVDRFSRMAQFDEADLMSDNLSLLRTTARDFGMAAARVRPNLVASVLLNNANLIATGRALFNATDGSDIGTGKALSDVTLSEAIAALAIKRDGDANLNLAPTHLLVPPALADLAMRLCTSPQISNDSGRGSKNPLAAYGITPVVEARLQTGIVDPVSRANLAGSASNWIVASSQGNTIEVTSLEGAGSVPVVIVETIPVSTGKFGTTFIVKHYLGARALDHLPFVRGRA